MIQKYPELQPRPGFDTKFTREKLLLDGVRYPQQHRRCSSSVRLALMDSFVRGMRHQSMLASPGHSWANPSNSFMSLIDLGWDGSVKFRWCLLATTWILSAQQSLPWPVKILYNLDTTWQLLVTAKVWCSHTVVGPSLKNGLSRRSGSWWFSCSARLDPWAVVGIASYAITCITLILHWLHD